MNEAAAEAVILAINALSAGILLFVSGVVQRIMNDMDELAFKKFAQTFGRTATNDPFAVTIATIPIFAVIFYFVMYGFDHWWLTVGIVVWTIRPALRRLPTCPSMSGSEIQKTPTQMNCERSGIRCSLEIIVAPGGAARSSHSCAYLVEGANARERLALGRSESRSDRPVGA
jgi:hypothetical protein